jgi:hypothetical protein
VLAGGRRCLRRQRLNARVVPRSMRCGGRAGCRQRMSRRLHAEVRWYLPFILGHGLIASAQKPSAVSTMYTSVKAAAVSISGNPFFDFPE